MSFDIFVNAFENGKRRFYPRTVLVKAFAGFCDMSDPTWWTVSDSFAVIQLDDAPEVDGFGVNRPPGAGHPLWPALFNVMRETSSVLYWPGGGPVITDASVEATLPRDMIKILGRPKVVGSITEIAQLIEQS